MPSNTVFAHTNTAIVSVAAAEAPIVVPSSDFDAQLAGTYERLGMRPGLLESVAGISHRRWWEEGVSFTDAATMAGALALEQSGVDPERIGLLIDTSVCRDHLEPSSAVAVHHGLGLPSSCLNFDLANACLGFVNAMHLAGTMIDSGTIEYALIVDGEGSRRTQEATLDRLARPETTMADFFAEFATLTLGSGGAAMVLGPSDLHPEGHPVVGGVARAATQYHDLCLGTIDQMRTDTKALLDAGLELGEDAWKEAGRDHWLEMDYYIIHQVSAVHTSMLCARLGIDPERAPLTFPEFGNIGPASVPFTLARQQSELEPGNKVILLGIGSGLNAAATEIIW